jgi:hypothetical protein
VIANLILHCLVTYKLLSPHIHPSGYGLGCGLVSSPKLFTTSSLIKLACDPLSTRVSILTLFVMTLMWKISPLLHLSFTTFELEELVLATEFIPQIPIVIRLIGRCRH